MAIEAKRGCGYRKVGGLYLMGGIINAPCDRLPMNLEICPVCSSGLKVGKGFTEINPFKLWGNHGIAFDERTKEVTDCHDPETCYVCYPPDSAAFLMRVGGKFYTVNSFMLEATAMGVSKRIPFIPRKLEVGKTPIYLVHKKAGWKYTEGNGEKKLIDETDAIFTAFVPTHIEQLVWEKDLKGKKGKALREQAEKRGITIVPVPNKDKDHDPNYKPKKKVKK